MTIEHVIFDKDGTLIDLNLYWGRVVELRAEALSKITLYSVEDLCHIMGYSLRRCRFYPEGPVGIVSRKRVIEILSTYTDYPVSKITEIFDQVNEDFKKELHLYVELLPGVDTFCRFLFHKGVRLSLITGDSAENAVKCLEVVALDQLFTNVIGREYMVHSKDCGWDAERLSKNKRTTIVVGDTLSDVKMAKNAGLSCYSVATGQVPFVELHSRNPNTFASMGEVHDYCLHRL